MALLKKKTRKAIRKSFKKAINKHGPEIAGHLATGIAAGLATYLGAEGEKGAKKLKKVAKALPGGKKVAKAISAAVPLLEGAVEKVPGVNGDEKTRRRDRSKKSGTA